MILEDLLTIRADRDVFRTAERLWAMSCWNIGRCAHFYGRIWKNMGSKVAFTGEIWEDMEKKHRVFFKVDLRKRMRTFRGTSSKSTNSRVESSSFCYTRQRSMAVKLPEGRSRYLMTAQWEDTQGPQGIVSHEELIDPVGFIVIFPDCYLMLPPKRFLGNPLNYHVLFP